MSDKMIKTRIAPSPTGMATIANLRTALFNYLYAKQHNGKFLFRLEDTDNKRFVEGAEKYMIKSLSWLGILPDEGINNDMTAAFRQSQMGYRHFVEPLLKSGDAYYAFDTENELDAMRKRLVNLGVKTPNYNNITREHMRNSLTMSQDEVDKLFSEDVPYVIRFNTPKNRDIKFNDLIRGPVSINTKDIDDKILFKSDGGVSYHFANVIDDNRQAITTVIRGSEWLVSTPTHILLYEVFGYDIPQFAHLPLVLAPDGSKISKRKAKDYDFPICIFDYVDYSDNETASLIKGFSELGYEPDALINILALTGWNDGTEKEFFSLEELVKSFSLKKVVKHDAKFDVVKLKKFNAHYMRGRDDLSNYNKWINDGSCAMHYSDENAIKINIIAKERCEFAKDLYKQVSYFFEPVVIPENHKLKHEFDFPTVMTIVMSIAAKGGFKWEAAEINKALEMAAVNTMGKTLSVVRPDLRFALCGPLPGPDLGLIMEILGPRESCKRIYAALPEVFQRTETLKNFSTL